MFASEEGQRHVSRYPGAVGHGRMLMRHFGLAATPAGEAGAATEDLEMLRGPRGRRECGGRAEIQLLLLHG